MIPQTDYIWTRTATQRYWRLSKSVSQTVKAKFHYTSWFGASSELAPNMFGASSELASVMEFGFKEAAQTVLMIYNRHFNKQFSWKCAKNKKKI